MAGSGLNPTPQDSRRARRRADIEGDVTRRILSTALISAAAAAAVLGIPATADDPTPTATASSAPAAVETATPAAPPAEAPRRPRPRRPRRRPREETPDARAHGDAHRDARATETPFPSPVETTVTPAPTATATAHRLAPTRHRDRDRGPAQEAAPSAPRTRSEPKNGQAASAPRHGKASTSTSASGCVKADAAGDARPGVHAAEAHERRRQPRHLEPELLALDSRPGEDRRAELLHRQVPDSSLPAPDLPGRRHAVRHPLGDPRGHQRDRDRLRPQPERLLRRRAGLDAVHARHVEGLRRRRQPGRRQGPVQPGRRDLRRRALPQGRRRRAGHPQGHLRLQPRRLVRRLAS